MMYDKNNVIYLFFGSDSEYSLTLIAKYMKQKKYNVIELDLHYEHNAIKVLNSIKGAKIVFITSWHLFFDKRNYIDFAGSCNWEVISPLEVIDYLHPVKSIYYPHDLACFLHEEEWKWLDLFDIVMLPFKSNEYYLLKKYAKVFEIGWIKKLKPTNTCDNNERENIVHFPSNLDLPPDEYYETWKPLFDTGLQVKLPIFKKHDDYLNILLKNNVNMIDSNRTVFDLIDECDLIVATGTSSVLYEAGFSGRPVISVFKNPLMLYENGDKLPDYEWLYKKGILEAAEMVKEYKSGNIDLHSGPDILKPINFELAEKIITSMD